MKTNRQSQKLSDRMKSYESTTDFKLIPRIPVYVRLDQRSGHTFTHGLNKPFDMDYVHTIQETTKYLVDKTNALIGYCQSDEISLVYESPEKMPFENRIFKIQSVFASMCTSAFIMNGMNTPLIERMRNNFPSFDCRVCQMNLEECANMILWRERDCIKNSITLLALSKFSTKQIDKKNSTDKIQMLKDVGVDYYNVPEYLRVGSYFRKEKYQKKLTEEEISLIPENKLPQRDLFGDIYVSRNRVSQVEFGITLDIMTNKTKVLFEREEPKLKL